MPSDPPGPDIPSAPKRRRLAQSFAENRSSLAQLAQEIPKNLELTSGAPSTRERRDRVGEQWDEYAGAIGLQANQCPNGDQVLGFLGACVEYMESRITNKPTISRSTILDTWKTLITILRFRHRHFQDQYTRHDIARIEEFIEQSVMDGKLHRGRFWKRQWLGFSALQEMITAYLSKCLSGGIRDWDLPIIGVLASTLQYALCARVGDMTRANYYTGKEFLAYKDVEIRLQDDHSNPPSVKDLKACVQLRYTKGQKQLDQEGRRFWFQSLQNASQNVMCPIKFILIMAMRTGQTNGITIEEVLEDTRARPHRRVRWRYPERPVVCNQNKQSQTEVDKPMSIQRVNKLLKDMAQESGMLDRVTSHAIRRGAMRDVAHLPASEVNVTDRAVGAALAGHSIRAFQSGLTGDYIGEFRNDFLKLRADNHSRDELAPRITSGANRVAQRLRPATVSQYMQKEGLDVNDRRARGQACRRMHANQATLQSDPDHDDADFVPETQSESDGDESASDDGESDGPADNESAEPESIQEVQEQLVLPDVDSRLAAFENLVFGGQEESPTGDIIEVRIRSQRRAETETALVLHDTPNSFVNYLASINTIMCSHGETGYAGLQKNTGGSRGEPTRFLFHCNQGHCVYSSSSRSKVDRHRKTCKGTAPNVSDYVCDICERTFRSAVTLRHHKKDIHTDQRRKCPHCEQEFQTVQEYTRHFIHVHDYIEDGLILCPCAGATDPECPSPDRTWDKWAAIRSHLRDCHMLPNSQMVALLGPRVLGQQIATSPNRWQCPARDCVQGFANRDTFRRHLRDIHHMSRTEIDLVVQAVNETYRTQVIEDTPPPPATQDAPTETSPHDAGDSDGSHGIGTDVDHSVVQEALQTHQPQTRTIEDTPPPPVIEDAPTDNPPNDDGSNGSDEYGPEVDCSVEQGPVQTQQAQTRVTEDTLQQPATGDALTDIPPHDADDSEGSEEFGTEVDFAELGQLVHDQRDDTDDDEFGYSGELDRMI